MYFGRTKKDIGKKPKNNSNSVIRVVKDNTKHEEKREINNEEVKSLIVKISSLLNELKNKV